MRLYLLPISTRRTLLYAERLNLNTKNHDLNYVDKGASWAAKKWAQWEKKESGWQRKVVDYGNSAFRRIPYEEWGLKSVPPLSARRRSDEVRGSEQVELCFPPGAIPIHKAEGIIRTLATERQALHRKRMIWSFVGMPISAPFALVPVYVIGNPPPLGLSLITAFRIPNLPFFYLVYRAWSHWKAIAGGRHVQWLVENKLLAPSPSKTLDELYSKHMPKVQQPSEKEQMLLTQKEVQSFSEKLNIPELEIELERAIWQVEQSLKESSKEEVRDEMVEVNRKMHETKEKVEEVKRSLSEEKNK